ncbi:hypothetical protein JCM3765_004555 [Sporobolomyces pararoseus]
MSYRLDYGKRVCKCKGPKPCKDSPIEKGSLRCATAVSIAGNTSFQYRHWGCVTEKVLQNLKEAFDEADEIDGFEELKEEDQEKVRKAFAEGHVDDADIPPTARKPESEGEGDEAGEEKPKKKKAATKRKKAEAADDDEEEEEKPKKKKAPAKKKKAKKEESDEEPEAVSSEEEKPKKKKKAAPKKKKAAKKEESEDEE